MSLNEWTRPHLVMRGERQACIEVALRDGARAFTSLDGLHETLRVKMAPYQAASSDRSNTR